MLFWLLGVVSLRGPNERTRKGSSHTSKPASAKSTLPYLAYLYDYSLWCNLVLACFSQTAPCLVCPGPRATASSDRAAADASTEKGLEHTSRRRRISGSEYREAPRKLQYTSRRHFLASEYRGAPIMEPLAGVYKPIITQPLQNDCGLTNYVLSCVWFGQVP